MITDYIIGSSFTAEMAVQGSYERTIGALTAAWRGSARTKEDEFNQALLDDYAKFLEQTPWYQYPFSDKLSVLWKDVPFELSLRSIERRFSLSLQYGVKSIYAKAIGALAGLSPADLEIGSVVIAPSAQALPSDGHIRVVREVRTSDGKQGVLIVTPRYQEFTDIIREIGAKNLRFGEIAGNTRILTTVLVPPTIGNGVSLTADGRLASDTGGGLLIIGGVRQIFETEVQSMPGWRRVGYDTDVATVATFAARVGETGIRFEHAYDY